jgi:anti-sigma regulatory factor (Ser/Thr protein kinase)
MISATFNAALDHLPQMLKWVRHLSLSAGFADKETKKIELALEEILVNIIHYAYPKAHGEIFLTFHTYPEKIQIVIQDRGVPFNPLLQKPDVDLDAELEERKEGGLGMHFTHALMDEVSYTRLEPHNILTLTKFL